MTLGKQYIRIVTSHALFLKSKASKAFTSCSLTTAATVAKEWASAIGLLRLMQMRGILLDGIALSASVSAIACRLLWQASLEQAVRTISSWNNQLSGAVASPLLGSCASSWQATPNKRMGQCICVKT